MRMKDVKRGARYETKLGQGVVDRIDTYNRVAYIVIDRPIPFGLRRVKAREIFEEVPAPK